MKITAPCVVSLTWRLEDAQGQLIDELVDPMEFFYGGNDLFAKVEEALLGQEPGFNTSVHLEPEHAFGDYQPELVCFEARELFDTALEEGMQFDGLPEGSATIGMPQETIYTITEIYPQHVVLDGNHPLAGIALRMHAVVRDVREATISEVGAGSVSDTGVTILSTLPPPPQVH